MHQVGIPILGVVENMSGLRQPVSGFRFKALDGNGGEQDVTQQVLAALKQQLVDQVCH